MTDNRLYSTLLFGVISLGVSFLNRVPDVRAQEKPAAESASSRKIDFTKEIQPIFEKSCHSCHGPKLQMAGLRLDSKQLAFTGGQSGKVIQPGKASESSLYQRVAGVGDQVRMPMGGRPLDPEQTALIRAWIDQGADWPDGVGTATAEIKKHWAYIPPQRPSLPKVSNSNWPANPIDHFLTGLIGTIIGLVSVWHAVGRK